MPDSLAVPLTILAWVGCGLLVVLAVTGVVAGIIAVRDERSTKKRPLPSLTLDVGEDVTIRGTTWIVQKARYDTTPGVLTVEMRPKS